MKKNIPSLLVTLLFFTVADADEPPKKWRAEDYKTNFYAKIYGGVNLLQDTSIQGNKATYEPGYILSGAVGYAWPCCLRLDAEYAYRRNAIKEIHFVGQGSSKNGHYQDSSFMANLSSWGRIFWNIPAFVGAGIGYDLQKMHSSNSLVVFNQKWNQFSWQLMAGFFFALSRNLDMTVEYKFHQGGTHFYNNSIGLALVYKFGYLK